MQLREEYVQRPGRMESRSGWWTVLKQMGDFRCDEQDIGNHCRLPTGSDILKMVSKQKYYPR